MVVVTFVQTVGRSSRSARLYDKNNFIQRMGGKLAKESIASQVTILGMKEEFQFLNDIIETLMKFINENVDLSLGLDLDLDLGLGQGLGMTGDERGVSSIRPMGASVSLKKQEALGCEG